MYILGQICGILGTVVTIIMPQFKRKNQMMVCNMLVNGLNGMNFLLIGQGGSAFYLCMVAIVQSAIAIVHEKRNTPVNILESILFLVLYTGFGFYGMISAEGFVWALSLANLLELLPIIGALMLMLSVFSSGEQMTRGFLFLNGCCWAVYSAVTGAAVFFTAVATMISTVIALVKFHKSQKMSQ